MENDINDEKIISIYIVSCFHNKIWENKLFYLTSPNKSIISIITKREERHPKRKNYLIQLHQININNNYNDIEKIALCLTNKNDNISLNLGEIIIKSDEERFFFNNLKFQSNDITKINEFCKEDINNNKNFDYYLELDFSTKLKIYYNYIEENNIKQKYSNFLVNNFLSSAKNEKILYSDIITLFSLSNGNKSIVNFLDNCYNFKFTINRETNSIIFINLKNLYFENKEKFNEQNIKFFSEDKKSKKIKINNYKQDIDNFMSLYILFYEEKESLSSKKILELDSILMKILNNNDNIVDYLNFLSSNFMVYSYFSKIKKKRNKN